MTPQIKSLLDALPDIERLDKERSDSTNWDASVAFHYELSKHLPAIIELAKQYPELIAVRDGIVRLKELHMTEGGMEMELKQSPEMAQWVAKCFASMVLDSPNYTEVKFDINGKYAGEHQWITLLIQKGNGKTPHQLRQESEEKLAKKESEVCGWGLRAYVSNRTVYHSDCGGKYYFSAIESDSLTYCPNCGRKIEVRK